MELKQELGMAVSVVIPARNEERTVGGSVAQVDMGSRAHRHQANHDPALMAAELLLVGERRRPAPQDPAGTLIRQFTREDGQVLSVVRAVPAHERPPASSVAEHHRGLR